MAEYKLDIFEVLNAVNGKKADYYDKLAPEEQKALQPYVLIQWLTGTDDERQIILLNMFANESMFALSGHKKLLWQLLTVCNSGSRQRYQWLKQAGKSSVSRPTCVALVQKVYGYGDRDANDALNILTVEDLIDMAFDLGMTGEEVTKIKKEMKK